MDQAFLYALKGKIALVVVPLTPDELPIAIDHLAQKYGEPEDRGFGLFWPQVEENTEGHANRPGHREDKVDEESEGDMIYVLTETEMLGIFYASKEYLKRLDEVEQEEGETL